MSSLQEHVATDQLDTRQPGENQTSFHLSEQGTVQGPKRRRVSGDRSALGISAHEQRYLPASLGGGTGSSRLLDGPLARTDLQVVYPANRKRAAVAGAAALQTYQAWKESTVEVCIKTGAILSITWDRECEGARDRLGPGSARSRKYAIEYLFLEVFGAAEESEWPAPCFHLRMGLPRVIMCMLNIPASAKEEVVKIMREISASHKAGTKYDPSTKIKAGRGAKVLIEDYTAQADVVYRTMESGMSLGNTLVVLSQWRRARQMEAISYGCLQRFVSHSPVMVLEKRETVKAGSSDMETTWAGARLAFAEQLVRQLRKGRRIAGGGLRYVPAEDGVDPGQAALEVPLFRGGLVFSDEHHRKCRLGKATKFECRIRRNSAGKAAPANEGGTLKGKYRRVTSKFEKEARGFFIVAEVKVQGDAAGGAAGDEEEEEEEEEAHAWAFEGRRLPPLDYTNQWVVGIATWEENFEAERLRVISMPKAQGGVGKGYEDAPGAMVIGPSGQPAWKDAVKKRLLTRTNPKAVRCVTDLIDHIITESVKLYEHRRPCRGGLTADFDDRT